jgi:hypothetical protein
MDLPPHYWLPIKSSSCTERKRQLEDILGKRNVKKVWHGSKKGRCYAVVCGPIDAISDDLLDGDPVLVEEDDDLDEA